MLLLAHSLTHSLTHSSYLLHTYFYSYIRKYLPLNLSRPSYDIRVYFSIDSFEENKANKSKQNKENKENNKYSVPTVAEELKATEIALTEIISEFEFARQQGNSLTHSLTHSITYINSQLIFIHRVRFKRGW